MDRDNNDSEIDTSSALNKSDTDKSLVGKFKSHVSGIINNTPLSKWFRKNEDKSFRSRDDEHDEELFQMQPPLKKVKLPEPETSVAYHYSSNLSNTPTVTITKNTFTSFPEPVAGPSGVKSRKLLTTTTTLTTTSRNAFNTTDLANGHKDSDSEESTSGYSSVARISSKEQVFESRDSSKQTSPLENSPTNSRSLFTGNKTSTMSRSLFNDSSPRLNTSLSSRRPTFNVSTFGSPNFVDKTLSTRRITNSPFYSGRTGYGGAAAYARRTNRLVADLKKPAKNAIQIKPVNSVSESSASLGKTAQRILSTLEQYSSPVNDAKKIPIASKKFRSDGYLSKYAPYTVRESKTASNSELQVPSVSELLKMKQSKERLQESTESVRQLATSSKSSLNVDSYKISTNDNEQQTHTGKIKNKVTSVRQKPQVDDKVEEVPLVAVALPISVLPKFDLQIPVKPAAVATTATTATTAPSMVRTTTPLVKARSPIKSVDNSAPVTKEYVVDYKFSKPFIISENLKSLVGINNYKFSEPLCKKLKADVPTFNFNMPSSKPFVPLVKPKHNGDNVIKTATELKSGSVMDVLGKQTSLADKLKPAEGTWECSTCLIRNQPDKVKCVACETTKPSSKKPEPSKPATKWECQTCLVKNNDSDLTCVACTAAKPAPVSTTTSLTKFQTVGTWECDACLVRNKNEVTKCVACETPKPGTSKPQPSLLDKFKQSGWECNSCLVRNKDDAGKCVACETPKPGATASAKSGFGDMFKPKADEWECGVCMVKNPAVNSKCLCCEAANPNAKAQDSAKSLKETKPIGSFNFGIDKSTAQSFSFGVPPSAMTTTVPSSTVSSVFGANAQPATAATPTFSFGIPANNKDNTDNKQDKEKQEKPDTSVKSAEPVKTVEPVKSTATPTFSFGVPASKPDTSSSSVTTSSVASNSITSSTTTNTPTFNFKPSTPVNGDAAKPAVFSFGSKPETPKSTSGFTLPAASATPTFNFGAGKTESATPNNGQGEAPKAAAAAPMFKFGASATTSAPATTNEANPFEPPAKIANGFGMTSAATNFNNSTTAPSFGTTANFSSESKPFSFNGNNKTVKEAPVFSFGGQPTTTPAASGGFNFTAPAAAPSTGMFNFSAPKSDAAAPMFGNAPPVKNGTAFNFGASSPNNNTQKAGFSFGASLNNAPAQPAAAPSGGFNFGAAPAAAPATGGFNFSAAPPAFDANAKPSFNFSQGQAITGFSAPQPAAGAEGQAARKIRKAVRRTQR